VNLNSSVASTRLKCRSMRLPAIAAMVFALLISAASFSQPPLQLDGKVTVAQPVILPVK